MSLVKRRVLVHRQDDFTIAVSLDEDGTLRVGATKLSPLEKDGYKHRAGALKAIKRLQPVGRVVDFGTTLRQ